ncbi:MAG: type IV secretory system conjugative DNA transfer family protein, partial [Actinomycetota bacterium]|nr:type IV secretory system conjugative DNA transfer family protein [Actinomycetota bacterium]
VGPPGLRGRPWFGLYGGDWGAGETWCGPESSLLLLGPPRSGKTSSIVVPCVLDAPAAVVSTSTKPDVLAASVPWRYRKGNCFLFDPSGTAPVPPGVVALRWSPVTGCRVFERAVATAHALAGAARPQAQISESAHWVERAEALLAPLLFAAAAKGVPMATLCRWVLSRDLREPEAAMADLGHEMATAVLAGVAATEDRERSGIFSTASGILAAYRSEAALQSASAPNFDPRAFAASADAVFVCAPAHAQDQLAPLIVCLLEQIRQAVFARPKGAAPVVFALDEVANIAPLPTLPALAAEGGGQGLVTLACLQDLSQARARWGEQAEGFFSIFNHKVMFPGIGDHRTLSLVSAIAGDVAVPLFTRTQGTTSGWKQHSSSRSVSHSWTYRPRLPLDAISNARRGSALHVSAGALRWLGVRPWWVHRRWSTLADGSAPPVWTEELRPLPGGER